MKTNTKYAMAAVGVIALIAAAVQFIVVDDENEGAGIVSESESAEEETSRIEELASGSRKKVPLRMKDRRTREKRSAIDREDQDDEPYDNVDDEERAQLTDDQCAMLEEIRKSMDDENRDALVKLVRKMQHLQGWPNSVPLLLRTEAIEALEWFGVSCLPEVAGFLGDPDESVVSVAIGQFEDAVEDSELRAQARADILVMASQVISNSDAMDSMLFELNNLPNSVAVDTVKKLWVSANATVKALLPDAVESLTGEDDIDTPEKLDAWLRENPDEADG